jgi:shikimate dehydrogenase/3-dehydroquinate dehydratase type I
MGKICLALAEEGLDLLGEKIRRYDGQCPLLEIRLDYLAEPRLPSLPVARRSELIATCRAPRQGGRYRGGESERLRLLVAAAEAGFDWLDVESDAELPPLPSATRVVRSHHDFSSFPTDLSSLYQKIRKAGGDIAKLSVPVSDTEQLTTLLRFMESRTEPRILIGMGPFGQASRLLGHFLDNAWTYVAEASEPTVAPGQFGLGDARVRFRLDHAGVSPAFYGVLGNPLAHSLSPPLHNKLFEHYGVNAVYLPFQLTSVDPWFAYVAGSRLRFEGFSVTLPFKTAVVKYAGCDQETEQALNTLVRADGGWRGLNTDYAGFLAPLRGYNLGGRKAVVLGAGGVAHTTVRALQAGGAEVVVAGRDRAKTESFARLHGCAWTLFPDLALEADLCVNCTPVGQYPRVDQSPLKPEQLRFGLVYDLIYRPEWTRLLEIASLRGAETISGFDMFVEQASLQFQAWTGTDPDRALVGEMLRTLLADASN